MTYEALVFCVTFENIFRQAHGLETVGAQADSIAHIICCCCFYIGDFNQLFHTGVDGLQLQQRDGSKGKHQGQDCQEAKRDQQANIIFHKGLCVELVLTRLSAGTAGFLKDRCWQQQILAGRGERDRDVLEQAQQNCLYGGGDAEHREQQHQEQAVSDSFHINKLFWNSDSLLPEFQAIHLVVG
jgi:hypothetical protein